MRRMLLLRTWLCVLLPWQIAAQSNLQTAIQYLEQQNPQAKNLANTTAWRQTDEVFTAHNASTHVYLRQQFGGIDIFNVNVNVALKEGKGVYSAGEWLNQYLLASSNTPAIDAPSAVLAAARLLNLEVTAPITPKQQKSSPNQEMTLSNGSVSLDDIPAKLTYYHIGRGYLRLAWELVIRELSGDNWWHVVIDAQNGAMLTKANWVAHCQFDVPHSHTTTSAHVQSHPKTEAFGLRLKTPAAINTPQYRVLPIPIESPNHGSFSLVNEPVRTNASPFGWLDVDGAAGADFTITRGNNVYAYEDVANTNQPGYSPSAGSSLRFDYAANLNGAPSAYLDASITNLFYWNNVIHDVFYQYGFDEPAGNFQQNNYNKGGLGNDFVRAESQDGSGTNNANFATPPDGLSGRMQMYLWGAPARQIEVQSPSTLAGNYTAAGASFGPQLTVAGVSGMVILASDGSNEPSLACGALVNGANMIGRIALIDRGTCSFLQKVKNAQDAGAIAVIIINNVAGAPTTLGAGAGDPLISQITIPAVMIAQSLGASLKNALSLSQTVMVNIRLSEGGQRDSSFDNGVVVHEYGHGISTRLTGGPANSSCLNNQEQMGEGWSDYFALVLTMKQGDVGTTPRGIGTFVAGQPITGVGIRPAPYTTNMATNAYTYADVGKGQEVTIPHGVGFIWCSMLWDMTWLFIERYGFDPDIYNGNGGNNRALRLVVDALKLQPCNPGFVDGRNAILAADRINNGGANQDLIWQAFARRGLGASASQGSTSSVTDGSAAFNLPIPLEIETRFSPTFVPSDRTVQCAITIKNIGNQPISQTTLSLSLPAETNYVSGSADNGGVSVANQLIFPSVTLAGGATRTYTFNLRSRRNSFTSSIWYDEAENNNEARWLATSVAGTNTWRLATGTTYSGASAWSVSNPATSSEQLLLLSAPIVPDVNTAISFYHYFDTESEFDGGLVEYSTDNGVTWLDLGNVMIENGYNATFRNNARVELRGRRGFSGTNAAFRRTTINLGGLVGRSVRLRFRFLSDNAIGGRGWWIDNIHLFDGTEIIRTLEPCVSYAGSSAPVCTSASYSIVPPLSPPLPIPVGESFVYYPNPTQNQRFNIAVRGRVNDVLRVYIVNVVGKLVLQQEVKLTDEELLVPIDTQNLAAGLYLLKMEVGGKTKIGKLVIQ